MLFCMVMILLLSLQLNSNIQLLPHTSAYKFQRHLSTPPGSHRPWFPVTRSFSYVLYFCWWLHPVTESASVVSLTSPSFSLFRQSIYKLCQVLPFKYLSERSLLHSHHHPPNPHHFIAQWNYYYHLLSDLLPPGWKCVSYTVARMLQSTDYANLMLKLRQPYCPEQKIPHRQHRPHGSSFLCTSSLPWCDDELCLPAFIMLVYSWLLMLPLHTAPSRSSSPLGFISGVNSPTASPL